MSITHRNPLTPPIPVPAIGPAGYQWVEPTFGSNMMRVSDVNSGISYGWTNVSFHTSSASSQRMWSADSAKFWTGVQNGALMLWSFNESTVTATTVGAALSLSGEPSFSDTEPNNLYGVNNLVARQVVKLDCSVTPPTKTVVLNLSDIVPGVTGNVGAFNVANGNLFCIFGASQDTHMHCVWFPLSSPASYKLLTTTTDSRIDVKYGMHSATMDKTGRIIAMTPWGGTVGAGLVYFWDTTLDTVTRGTGPQSGHAVFGALAKINNDTASGSYDSRRWTLRPNLLDPNATPVSLPGPALPLNPRVGGWGADHSSWAHSSPANPLVPFISGSYRYGDGPGYAFSPPDGMGPVLNHLPDAPSFLTPWRAWDDEIISIATDGSDIVTRYCHTNSWLWRNPGTLEPSTGSDIFYYTPRPNQSPNGRWVLFNSNWGKSLGTAVATNIRRVDVFLVELSDIPVNPPPPPTDPSSDLNVHAPRQRFVR